MSILTSQGLPAVDDATDPAAAWVTFRRDVAECGVRLLTELRSARTALDTVAERQVEHFTRAVSSRETSRHLDTAAALYAEHGPPLLHDPVQVWRRERPHFRAVAAFDTYDRAVERLIGGLPRQLAGTGREWAALVGADRSYLRRALLATGVQADPEGDLFEAIHRQSGGVFRTALALWQRYIDRVDSGVIYMLSPAKPEYEEMVAALSTSDLFTLAGLLQHGSLTSREHAVIFQVDETRSRAWLDALLARELIELDSGRYGFRVVPEAGQIVRETLFRRNLA